MDEKIEIPIFIEFEWLRKKILHFPKYFWNFKILD